MFTVILTNPDTKEVIKQADYAAWDEVTARHRFDLDRKEEVNESLSEVGKQIVVGTYSYIYLGKQKTEDKPVKTKVARKATQAK